MDSAHPKSILITGASSGIGAALAVAYAGDGTTLHLGGRDRARLEAVAAQCRRRGARVHNHCQDVADAAGMTKWIEDAFASGPVDLVIANAGIGGEGADRTQRRDGGRSHIPDILATNVAGVINTVYPSLDRMLARPRPVGGIRGQIAIMSSLAGFRGMPTAPAYCASKAALCSFGEGLRQALVRSGVKVSVICPGFVRSPMTATNDFPMPFLMTGERAARIIQRGLARRRARITFPRRLAAAVWIFAALPPAWSDPLVRRFRRQTG
ncbi:MAG: SDR family NAD(P)-dependent oxidoreductase [Alphaproteobacteria bacterium]|nr:SDR family NAD(P)-dependent oxidoreductase [Alphaproteobacteria bacterium]